MLDLSWGTVCGLYALHFIARSKGDVTAKQIAEYGNLSESFLSKALQRLRRDGFVRSQRGRGYALGRPAEDITVLEVVRSLEGPIGPATTCLMKNTDCVFKPTCPMSLLCRELTTSILSALGSLTLASLPVGTLGLPVCMDGRKNGVH